MSENRKLTVGIDLGGTKIRGGVCDFSGKVLNEITIPTRNNSDSVHSRLVALLTGLLATHAPQEILGIVIGGAGTVSPNGEGFDFAPNLNDLGVASIRSQIEQMFQIPTALENDVNVAAYGEYIHGAGENRSSLAYVSVGTGIGLGLVLGGDLIRGSKNLAGEIGMIPLGPRGVESSKHGRGSLEDLVAGDSFERRYNEKTFSTESGNSIIQLAKNGDKLALSAIEQEATGIAFAISCIQFVVDPEVIVLGGGIGSEKLIFDSTKNQLQSLLPLEVEIIQSLVPQNAAPILGAAELARTFFGKDEKESHRNGF